VTRLKDVTIPATDAKGHSPLSFVSKSYRAMANYMEKLSTADKLRCMFYLKKNRVDVKNWTFSDLENIFQAMHSYASEEYRYGIKNKTSLEQLQIFEWSSVG